MVLFLWLRAVFTIIVISRRCSGKLLLPLQQQSRCHRHLEPEIAIPSSPAPSAVAGQSAIISSSNHISGCHRAVVVAVSDNSCSQVDLETTHPNDFAVLVEVGA